MKRLLIALVILVALLIPVGFAMAQTIVPASTSTTTYACETAAGAPVTSSTDPACTGSTLLSGALTGYNIVHVQYTNANPGDTAYARCAQGQVVIGGGASLGSLNDNADITASRPSGVDGWAAAYRGTKHSLNVYAICATSA